jgi:murein DD-endopeptidase MepM/ murein hydrolase activator NlpD
MLAAGVLFAVHAAAFAQADDPFRLAEVADVEGVRPVARNFHAEHAPLHHYRLPFADGHRFMVSQAAGGLLTTHAAPDSWHAVDIAMPHGTPVVAARGGIVIEAAGGVVRVLHDDGTIAGYYHLAGLAVAEGDGVAAGRVLGVSGASGHASGPHLHFVVTRLVVDGESIEEISEPVTFYAGRPPRALRARTGSLLNSDYPTATLP